MADSGAAALEVASSEGERLRLVVSDVVMPGVDGKTLADELVRRLPGVRVLFVSGYTQDVISHHGVLDSGIEFLQKPFTSSALLRGCGACSISADGHDDLAYPPSEPAHRPPPPRGPGRPGIFFMAFSMCLRCSISSALSSRRALHLGIAHVRQGPGEKS